MLAFTARDYLQRESTRRRNPLWGVNFFCGLFVVGDHLYLEGFLFGVEFLLLVWLVVKFFSTFLQTRPVDIKFELRSEVNPYPLKQTVLVHPLSNTLRFFNLYRSNLFYSAGHHKLNSTTIQILDQLFQPYNQQVWLLKVYESFLGSLQHAAAEQLANDEQLADE